MTVNRFNGGVGGENQNWCNPPNTQGEQTKLYVIKDLSS
jgi:hypothetical protein